MLTYSSLVCQLMVEKCVSVNLFLSGVPANGGDSSWWRNMLLLTYSCLMYQFMVEKCVSVNLSLPGVRSDGGETCQC